MLQSQASMRSAVLTALLTLLVSITPKSLSLAQEDALPQPPASLAIDTDKENKVKAVYLYSFGRLTRWPTVSHSKRGFTIGVVGQSGIDTTLTKVARKRTVQERSIVVKQYADTSEVGIADCEIVFVSRSVPDADVTSLMAVLRDAPVLTVTESTSSPPGTVVNFVLEGEGIKFEIDIEEAQRKRLAMDARLLRQGRKMLPRKQPKGP